jgi:plastocyanin
MKRLLMVLALSLPIVAMGPPARASTVTVADFAFSPGSIKVAQGGSVAWHNNGPHTHTSTQNAGLWATGNIASGTSSSSVGFAAAGSYAYHCSIHPTMKGSVKVPILVAPSSGITSTRFLITVASVAVAGFTYDVQRRVGTGPWKPWKSGLTARTARFRGSRGTDSFRSREVRTSDGARSGWSPAAKITIA